LIFSNPDSGWHHQERGAHRLSQGHPRLDIREIWRSRQRRLRKFREEEGGQKIVRSWKPNDPSIPRRKKPTSLLLLSIEGKMRTGTWPWGFSYGDLDRSTFVKQKDNFKRIF
jgi:hypothetical protein